MSKKLKSIRATLVFALLLFVGTIQAQTIKVNVKDSSGEAIIGASVVEKGTSNGAVTDFDGNAVIKSTGKSLTISYIGMKKKTVDPKGKAQLNIVLEEDNTTLNDVVVIGYQTVRKKDLTGAVASVSSKQLEDIPVTNVTEAMTGKLAGVSITTSEGSPDAEVSIRVRGGGSLSQDNSPLYIVDGFPVASISDVAPSDIQSIDVLKDASSTAIYGAKGANGVVIITTKSGKEGKVQVNMSAQYGMRKSVGEVKVASPYEFALYQQEWASSSNPNPYGNYSDLDIYNSLGGRNYQDEMFGRTGNTSQLSVNVSGGSKETKWSTSYTRSDEKAIMLGSGFKRDNFTIKLQTVLNKWLTLDVNDRFSYTSVYGLKGGADTGESSKAYSVAANAIKERPINRLTSDLDDEAGSDNFIDPITRVNATYKQQNRLQNNINGALTWEPIKGLKFKSEYGYGWRYNNTDQVWVDGNTGNSKIGGSGQPRAEINKRVQKEWRWANTANYDVKKLFMKGDHLNVLLGQEVSSSFYNDTYNSAINFDNSATVDQILAMMGQGDEKNVTTYIGLKDNMSSYFGRLNYTINDRYLMTFTMRADGSSRFTDGNRWGYFPSLALAWRVVEEPWMKGTSDWLSNLKLRLSYGTAGNNRIDAKYMYSTYSTSTAAIYFNDVTTQQIAPGTLLSNPDLKWETTITRNIGIDFGFLNSRINGSVDLYWNTTKDLLMRQTINEASGYSVQYQNVGQTSNKGIELQLNANIFDKKEFALDFNFNISYNRGKIDKFPYAGTNGKYWVSSAWAGTAAVCNNDFLIEEGGRLGEVYGYIYDGVYTTNDLKFNTTANRWEIRTDESGNPVAVNSTGLTGATLEPGAIKIKDTDGNGTVDADDKVRLGNTVHPWTGGFGFSGRFLKGFDFNVFFNYQLGGKLINGTKAYSSYRVGSEQNKNINEDFTISRRWTRLDPVTGENMYDRTYAANYIAANGEDAYYAFINSVNAGKSVYNAANATTRPLLDTDVEDASFLRLQTITLGYTLPKNIVKKLGLSNVRVFASGYNLFCITKYSGVDPEVNACSDNPMTPGVDYATYPKSYSILGGINVSF